MNICDNCIFVTSTSSYRPSTSCGKVMFSVVSVCSHLSATGRLAFDGNAFLLGYSVYHNAIVHLLEIPVHTVQHMYLRQCYNANFSI